MSSAAGLQSRRKASPATVPLCRKATRAAKPSVACVASSTSLLSVPGIGNVARDRLANAEVNSVAALCALYVEEHRRDKDELRKFLKGLGIHSRWTRKIADWVHDETAAPLNSKKQLTFCVEGNIGAGKTTWLEMVRSTQGELHELIEVVPEPVGEWQDNGHGTNLLDLFYKDPEKYAFAFQQFVLITRLKQEENSSSSQAGLRLLERSVFCDRMVFVRAVHELHHLNNVELEVYDSWFNPLLKMRPQLIPDGFVYLKTDADTCARRIFMRNRSEESTMPLSYLEQLHDFHNTWLVEGGNKVPPSIPPRSLVLGAPDTLTRNTLFPAGDMWSLNGASFRCEGLDTALQNPQVTIPQLPSILQGNVVLLDRGRLKQSTVAAASQLHLTPALHVDCVEDVNLDDPDVISHRAEMMQAYRAWVHEYQLANKKLLEAVRSDSCEDGAGGQSAGTPPPSGVNLPSGSLEVLANMPGGSFGVPTSV